MNKGKSTNLVAMSMENIQETTPSWGRNEEKTLPVALAERMQAKLVSYLCSIHCIRQILFVGKYKQNSLPEFILKQD